MIKLTIDTVKKLDLFSNADPETLEVITKLLKIRTYPKGSYVFLEDQPAFGICFLINGSVKITKSDSSGKEHILKLVKESSVFGEVVLFNGGNYPATAITIQDSEIAILYNNDLEEQIKTDPQLALNLIKIISVRLRNAQDKIKQLALMDTKRRLYSLIINWSNNSERKGDSIYIDVSLTQQEIADLIGTTRETVTRTLKELKDSKVIEMSKGQIILLDMDRLKTYALI
ncbi:Crp/Fnr family transcriptional regulator [Alkalicella caledoniensis]|uniref:Crp/Fnr family transcriptional regulator n=1 Tax=Alkalicella caledoniensis TaxID=2731377 RepID=A0A7G9W4H5_ALKCA|nr:Crp/Fnr family transcriptional regulator [Alkalicella caledoniensis]QNO13587.1 Crp/Fnr family transcriptional regulator [Alkalicella caledoniensis]